MERVSDSTAVVVSDLEARRQAWLAERRTMITGTDAAKILGLSNFGGPIDVYLSKIGEEIESESPYVEGGRRFESEILRWYEDRERARGADIERVVHAEPFTVIRSDAHARVGASLDAVRIDRMNPGGAPVDAKNIRWQTAEYGEDGTDRMPLKYAIQLVIQMHVLRATIGDLPTVFSGQDLVVYRLHHDADLEAEVVGRCNAFWTDHVEKRIPPPVDGSKSYTDWLARKFSKNTEDIVPSTPELEATA